MTNKTMRRSALIGPWGVGAIVPFPNDESLMIAGLDMWRYGNDLSSFQIDDDRLKKRLGVDELRFPPDYREKSVDKLNFGLTIPTVRFPTWYYCPYCGSMKKTTYYEQQPKCDQYQWGSGRVCKYSKRMIPERFIVICPNGHIDDFPVAEWLHYGTGLKYNPETCRIRRSTGGASASLSGVYYSCTCGAKRSIAGAMNPGALNNIKYKCKGLRPWLGEKGTDKKECNCENLQVVLRGASNVWFANTVSSIYIPIIDSYITKHIIKLLDEYYGLYEPCKTNKEIFKNMIFTLANKEGVEPNLLYEAFLNKDKILNDSGNKNISEEEYRFAEYKVLVKSSGKACDHFHSLNYKVAETFDKSLIKFFSSISLVKKLQETRAFVGFSRVAPREISVEERKEILRLGEEKWLPAIQVNGEGIFFEFNAKEIENWAKSDFVIARIATLQKSFKQSQFGSGVAGELRAEYVLIHTFAHLLINQLSFECGYGSSAIRERIYCERTDKKYGMYGVLIYTASGDSEGSLGGLVRQGKPGRIEDLIKSAIQNAAWCSSDPVCIQSSGQGPESLNLAACYNCALLPETCCECGNRLLDRGLLIGSLEHKEIGFFADLLES